MRVVGYVRESQGLADSETAYAQGERIRRWVAEHGHHLVAVFRDTRDAEDQVGREGYRALLHVVRAGEADAVVVARLEVLSSDKVLQEIMIHDIRSHGLAIASTEPADLPQLAEPPEDATRLVVRDVLARAEDYVEEFSRPRAARPLAIPHDVVVELVAAEPDQLPEGPPQDNATHTARPSA